jgi:hypothetical protein
MEGEDFMLSVSYFSIGNRKSKGSTAMIAILMGGYCGDKVQVSTSVKVRPKANWYWFNWD